LRWQAPLLKGAKVRQAALESFGQSLEAEVAKEQLAQRTSYMNSACLPCSDKTFSEPCPESWESGDDGLCHAPSSYMGVCAKSQSFVGANRLGKSEVEVACGVCWPCPSRSRCEIDWSQPCPNGYARAAIPYDGYAEASGSTCVRQSEGGECDHEVAFHDGEDKMQFAARCSVTWPCVQKCSGTLSICPADWEDIGGAVCAAPPYFKSPGCPLLQSFHGWTSAMKLAYAQNCSAAWRCAGSGPKAGEGNGPLVEPDCNALDLAPTACPRSWVRLANGACDAPSDYGGPCARQQVFVGMSDEQKLKWASQCLVAWRCQGEITIESDARVPWITSVDRDNGAV